jgi:hypothetical protein
MSALVQWSTDPTLAYWVTRWLVGFYFWRQ